MHKIVTGLGYTLAKMMFELVFLICICFLKGLFGNQTNEENGNLMQCIELPSPRKHTEFESIFRSARRRPKRLPRAVMFKTDIGLSEKLVNQLGGTIRAYNWVNQVIKIAKKHFQHRSLKTKVYIKVMETKNYPDLNPSLHQLIEKYRKNARYPLGFFAANNRENNYIGTAEIESACTPKHSAYIVEKVYNDPKYAAGTLAHEIGHVIGMYHNSDRGCQPGNTVMSKLAIDVEGWTKCNNEEFRFYYMMWGYNCLF